MAVTEDCQRTQNHRIGGWRGGGGGG